MGVYESGATIGPGQTAQVVPQRTESPRPPTGVNQAVGNEGFIGLNGEVSSTPVFQPGS